MRPLYLLVEEINRELLSRLLIARAAVALGHPVVIGQQWWLAANFAALPPGVALFKGNNRIQALFMQQARKAGHRTASIDEEAFVSSSVTEIAAQYHGLAEAHCDLFLTQGAFQHRAVCGRFPGATERIVITGNPRADLLRDPRFRPHDPLVDRYRESLGPYVLMNTNFTTINPKLGDVYSYYKTCLRVGVLDDPEMPPFKRFMTWCNWERENLKAMVSLLRRLSGRSDQRRIVLRPHPSESAEIWTDELAGLPGVEVFTEGDHLAWIDRADRLVHSGCSTGLEAYLLGRRAISLTPGDRWWKTPALSNLVNPVATTVEAAEALLATDTDEETTGRPDPALELGEYLLDEPGESPADRIAVRLSDLAERVEDRPHAPAATVTPAASSRMVAKAFVTLKEIRRRLGLVEAATARGEAPGVSEIGPSVFQIGGDAPLITATAS